MDDVEEDSVDRLRPLDSCRRIVRGAGSAFPGEDSRGSGGERSAGPAEVRPGETGAGLLGAAGSDDQLQSRKLLFYAGERRKEDPAPPSSLGYRDAFGESHRPRGRAVVRLLR